MAILDLISVSDNKLPFFSLAMSISLQATTAELSTFTICFKISDNFFFIAKVQSFFEHVLY